MNVRVLVIMHFTIRECFDSEEKKCAISSIDDAFTISIINRENFDELFDKIDHYAEFVVAMNNEKIVGYAAFYANNTDTKEAFITLIGVDKGFQHRGIGTLLIQGCKKIAAQKGMNAIRLEVLCVDAGAQQFYKKMGFQKIGSSASGKSLFFSMKI